MLCKFSCPMQVPIYTLHMLTFPQPERFWPQRWADPAQQHQQQGKAGAPAEGKAGAAGVTLQVQVIAWLYPHPLPTGMALSCRPPCLSIVAAGITEGLREGCSWGTAYPSRACRPAQGMSRRPSGCLRLRQQRPQAARRCRRSYPSVGGPVTAWGSGWP